MSTTPGPTIEVFADIWCPFAHVGLRAIEEQCVRTGRSTWQSGSERGRSSW